MDNQLFSYTQTYLSTILSLNILLATANGILLLQKHKTSIYQIFILISLVSCIFAIAFTVYSYQEVIVFLIRYKPTLDITILTPLKPLNLVFKLNIFSLTITAIVLFCSILKRREK